MCHFVSVTKMSEKRKEKMKKLQSQIEQNQNAIQHLLSRATLNCVSCSSNQIKLIFCSSCGSIPICKLHFRNRPRTRQCPKCGQPSLSRRWSMPVPQ